MIEYCYYPGGKRKALSFSYDDGREEDRRLVKILNENKLKGTFNLNGDRIGTDGHVTASEIKTLYQNHEVASHTYTHPFIISLPKEDLLKEIMKDRERLESLTGKIVRGFAPPFEYVSESIYQVIDVCGFDYCRMPAIVSGFIPPTEFMRWGITCMHHQDILNILKQFENLSQKPWRTLPFFNLVGHSYELNENNNWEKIKKFCQKASELQDTWFASNIEICDYLKAVWGLKKSVDNHLIFNPSAKDVWIGVEGEPIELKSGACLEI